MFNSPANKAQNFPPKERSQDNTSLESFFRRWNVWTEAKYIYFETKTLSLNYFSSIIKEDVQFPFGLGKLGCPEPRCLITNDRFEQLWNWKFKLKSTKIFGKNAELSKKSKTWKLLFSIIETWTSQICQTRMKENPSNSISILILKVLFILIQEFYAYTWLLNRQLV